MCAGALACRCFPSGFTFGFHTSPYLSVISTSIIGRRTHLLLCTDHSRHGMRVCDTEQCTSATARSVTLVLKVVTIPVTLNTHCMTITRSIRSYLGNMGTDMSGLENNPPPECLSKKTQPPSKTHPPSNISRVLYPRVYQK